MFLNRNLLFAVGIILLILNACSPKDIRALQQKELTAENLNVFSSQIDFSSKGLAKFRFHIAAFDQNLSGLLILQEQEDSIRAVMMTDFGLKVIDISFFNQSAYRINHIMKHIDYDFVKESFALNLMMILPLPQKGNLRYYLKNDLQYIYQKETQILRLYNRENNLRKVERYTRGSKIVSTANYKPELMEWVIIQENPSIEMIIKRLK
ncbi:MAG: hypothetical protein B7C24_00715 [Bacteroidetes bacterium 4572_77]|nr:MAG: hypothetical protein B7C24_00715 [Bacteroidetes bacterium 4572_77]